MTEALKRENSKLKELLQKCELSMFFTKLCPYVKECFPLNELIVLTNGWKFSLSDNFLSKKEYMFCQISSIVETKTSSVNIMVVDEKEIFMKNIAISVWYLKTIREKFKLQHSYKFSCFKVVLRTKHLCKCDWP